MALSFSTRRPARGCSTSTHADPRVLFGDIRHETHTLCDGRALTVAPDFLADYRRMPHADESFRVVVFDPPHLTRVGKRGWMFKKYGGLDVTTWRDDLTAAFAECFRVLKDEGVLIFKWNETQIPVTRRARPDAAPTARWPPPGWQVRRHPLDHVPEGR